jgi:hypothetical protein
MVLSPSCLDALSAIDEIWAPTRFIQASLVLATEAPALHMPVAWRFPTSGTPTRSGSRRPYVLAEDDSLLGGGALHAVVGAYVAAFGSWARQPADTRGAVPWQRTQQTMPYGP